MMKTTVFLDRDGVINTNRDDYVKSWSEFNFLPGVLASLRLLAQFDWNIVVISNQSIIGRNIAKRSTVDFIHHHMQTEIKSKGGRIDAVYYCPHKPSDACDCRKPRPGLLVQASSEMGLELENSYFIGDALSDIEVATVAGCTPVFVCTGRGKHQKHLLLKNGYDYVPITSNLTEAIKIINNYENSAKT